MAVLGTTICIRQSAMSHDWTETAGRPCGTTNCRWRCIVSSVITTHVLTSDNFPQAFFSFTGEFVLANLAAMKNAITDKLFECAHLL